MQSASALLAPVAVPQIADCMVFASHNGDSSSEVNPVNLVTYANRIQKSGVDIMYRPSDVTSYSVASQNSHSPSKSNCPIDLVVSAPREQAEKSELLNCNDPVDLAAYAYKRPDFTTPSSHSVNEITATSVRNTEVADGSQPLASVPNSAVQTVATHVQGQGTLSGAPQPGAYQNAAAVCSIAAVYSSRPLQTVAYPHNVSLSHSMPSSCHSAQWQPMLSPRTAQLMATAVCNTSGQHLHSDGAMKEAERNPLLLQLQTALLHGGFPPTMSSQCQSAATLATQRRQFACTICSKMLSSQHNLRLHEATIHRGLFQFHCPICNKGLRQERDLRGHLANRHDWKKEFRCSICGHEFGYKRNLKHHVMSHHGKTSLDE